MGRTAGSGGSVPAVWLPSVRTGSGTDNFTERLVEGLTRQGYRAEIAWLPLRTEFAPWSVPVPPRPAWANVLHVNSWMSTRFVPANMPVVATVHLCVHDASFAAYRSGMQALYHRYWIRRQESRMLRRATLVTAVSSQSALQTRRAFPGVEPIVVHNGLHAEAAWGAPRPPRREGPFRLLYCGNWSRRKGVDLLEPLMRMLGDGFELLYTPDRDGSTGGFPVPSNARSLGRLAGPEALAQAYRLADVLVFPSRMEGLPLVPMEAMACGLPVVASDASSVTDLVLHGETGLLAPADDLAAFAAAIVSLRDDPVRWAAMSEAARRRQGDEFSETRMLAGYLAAYRQALERVAAQGARTARDVRRRSV